MGCLPFLFGGLGKNAPISAHIASSCSVAALILLMQCFISSVCIVTTMGYFLYSVDHYVVLVFFGMVVWSFMSLINTWMSSGFKKYFSTYYFSFSLNCLNLYYASICQAVVPKTTPNYNTLPLKSRNEGVLGVRFKYPPCPPLP